MSEALTEREQHEVVGYGRVLSDYERGYIDAMTMYAIWDNGNQYIGVQRRPLQVAARAFVESRPSEAP